MDNKMRFWPPVMIIIMIIWATFYPIIKYMVSDIDPLILSFYRYLFGFTALSPFFLSELKKQKTKPAPVEIIIMSTLGFIGITLFSVGLFYGIKLSTAVNGSLLANTQPIFTAILGTLLISEVLSRRKIYGVFMGIAGMVLVVTNGNFTSFVLGGTAVIGNLLLIAAAAALSLYSILIKKYVGKFGSLFPTWISMTSGTILLLIINTTRGQNPLQIILLPIQSIIMILYLGIIGTSLTYLMFNMALNRMSVTVATSYKLLIPVFGLLFAFLFLGEKPGIPTLAGILIVVISVYVIQKVPKLPSSTSEG